MPRKHPFLKKNIHIKILDMRNKTKKIRSIVNNKYISQLIIMIINNRQLRSIIDLIDWIVHCFCCCCRCCYCWHRISSIQYPRREMNWYELLFCIIVVYHYHNGQSIKQKKFKKRNFFSWEREGEKVNEKRSDFVHYIFFCLFQS